jgi:hypothetical protein
VLGFIAFDCNPGGVTDPGVQAIEPVVLDCYGGALYGLPLAPYTAGGFARCWLRRRDRRRRTRDHALRWKRNPAYIPVEERGRVRKRGVAEAEPDDDGRDDGEPLVGRPRFGTPLRAGIALVTIGLIAVFVARGSYIGAAALAVALVANEVLIRRRG